MSSDDETDFGADTQMFQAFVDRHREPEPPGTGWKRAGALLGAVLLVAIALAIFWLLSG
jgi:hypothetical protein